MASPRQRLPPPPIITSVSTSFASGSLVVNDFTFLSTLGAGSYGEVVLARRGSDGKLFAVKCFNKPRLLKIRSMRRVRDANVIVTALESVQRELRILTRLAGARAPPSSNGGGSDNSGISSSSGIDGSGNGGGGGGGGGAPLIAGLHMVLADAKLDDVYFVLDYVDGGPVMSCIDESACLYTSTLPGGGALPLAAARQVIADVGAALASLHAQGIAHRDVKPSNVLVSSDGCTRLCDFGSAELYAAEDAPAPRPGGGDASDVSGDDASDGSGDEVGVAAPSRERSSTAGSSTTVTWGDSTAGGGGGSSGATPRPRGWVTDSVGTFLFLSPEAATGVGYSAFDADLWATGVLLFVCVFATVPFGVGLSDALAVFEAIATADLVFPWDRAAGDGESERGARALADLLSRLLSRDPATRIRTPAELLSHEFTLGRWLESDEDRAAAERGDRRTRFPPLDTAALERYTTTEMALFASIASVGAASDAADAAVAAAAAVTAATTAAAADAGAAGVIAVEGADMAGWLIKRGRAFKTWRTRFFVLRGTTLTYFYATASEAKATGEAAGAARAAVLDRIRSGKPLGSLDLSTAPAVVARAPKANKPLRFSVTVPGRVLFLQANSDRELGAWEAAFTTLPCA